MHVGTFHTVPPGLSRLSGTANPRENMGEGPVLMLAGQLSDPGPKSLLLYTEGFLLKQNNRTKIQEKQDLRSIGAGESS